MALLLRRQHRVATAAAALLATLGLAAPSARAATYTHYSLNFAGYANADGWDHGTDTQGLGYHAEAILLDRALGSWNVGGGRSGYQTGEYTAARYTAPA